MSTTDKFFTFILCLLFYSNKNNAFGSIHSSVDRAAHPSPPPPHQIKCVEKERQALLNFKQEVKDEYNKLLSWGSNGDCCKWDGVSCHNQTGNVITLNLQLKFLSGEISVSLLELKYLEHLDLSYNSFDGSIPPFLGSFTRLTYLDLFFAGFSGKVPHQLGNLSSLNTFHLGSFVVDQYTDNLEWLSSLQSLTTLSLWGLNLSSDWAATVSSLYRLRVFSMRSCTLPYLSPSSLNSINYSAPLDNIELCCSGLNSSVYSWLFNFNDTVTQITLSETNLGGPIPDGFANIASLTHLDLSGNNLQGKMLDFLESLSRRASRTLEYLNLGKNLITGPLPDTIARFQSLKELTLWKNQMSGSFPKAIAELPNLTFLDLSLNQIGGVLPERIGLLTNLTSLYLSFNQIGGLLPESIGLLANLEVLYLDSNKVEGVISQSHLRNLSRLQRLDLSFNSGLACRFDLDWIPPFQLQVLRLGNCKLGPHFPKWIQTQKNISRIALSASGISDEIPSWFWDQMLKVTELDLSNNLLVCSLPDLYTKIPNLALLNLSSNYIKGPIPRLPNTIQMVDLSKNRFSGEISFLCDSPLNSLTYLDLSENHLSGELFDCWEHLRGLELLNLNNNNLSGNIPSSMGSLPSIQTLLLRRNSFTNELPRSWPFSASLWFIDLGVNRLSGAIPEWLGRNLTKLVILNLSWNNFSGSIPHNICNLSQLQILDLSGNKISGRIPKCISDFSEMIQERNALDSRYFIVLGDSVKYWYSYEAFLTWKGREAEYKSSLQYVKSIDLSSNRLTGDIPLEVISLLGLIALNLSRNHLTGIIPLEIGKLKSLDFLDLSRNQISGEIPSSLSQISLLGVLDLSYNNLIGRIPTGTQLQSFNASSYTGNLGLCGEPLTRVCPGDELPQHPKLEEGDEEHEDKFISTGVYIVFALGFIVGFWGVCGSLILNRSLRYAFYGFINIMQDWLYVITVKLFRCCRGGFNSMNK